MHACVFNQTSALNCPGILSAQRQTMHRLYLCCVTADHTKVVSAICKLGEVLNKWCKKSINLHFEPGFSFSPSYFHTHGQKTGQWTEQTKINQGVQAQSKDKML